MKNLKIDRRNWLKLSGLGSVTTLVGSSANSAVAQKPDQIKGIVFLVSDGMSNGVLSLAEDFSRFKREKETSWRKLIANPAATTGLMETSSANSYVTDSAAAGSAWGSGFKINNGAINVRPDGTKTEPILRHLKKQGFNTGLVSTARITHATPASFAANVKWRNDEHLIAPQYLDVVDILLGGGLKFFDKNLRTDGQDAINPYQSGGYEVSFDRDSLLQSKGKRVLGLFANEHLPYEVDRLNTPEIKAKVPSLAEMSDFTLQRFLADDSRFFLQIEAGRVDHAAHANDIAGIIWDQLAFDDTVEKVLAMIADRDDILVIVTSDHGNANPGLNGVGSGYTGSNEAFHRVQNIITSHEALFESWGRSEKNDLASLRDQVNNKFGISLKNPEAEALFKRLIGEDVIEWSNQLNNPDGLLGQFIGNHTGTGWTGTTHTSDPTLITAVGPGAERFSGMNPNQDIHRHMLELLG